jgi:hypothetical protein
MRKKTHSDDSANAISRYFSKANLPSQQEILGSIVSEILKEGGHLNRKSLCTKLLSRLENAASPGEESHYNTLITILFD